MDDLLLVHRANAIAQFFSAYPPEEAVAGIADHLSKFWEPRMRRQLMEFIEADRQGLHELVPRAVSRLRLTATGALASDVPGCAGLRPALPVDGH